MTDSIVKLFDSSEIRFVNHPENKFAFGIVAADMALVLELDPKQTNKMPVDDEWKGQTAILTLGGEQSMTVIWEPGVYQLLAKSRKPKAKPFQKWLYETVLPSIRETGSYSVVPVDPVIPQLPQRDPIDYINAAALLPTIDVNPQLKRLLEDYLTDDLELRRNLANTPKKEYTIVKVRAKELGYNLDKIQNGSQLGKYVARHVPATFKKRIGDFEVNHYEVSPRLDDVIHSFFR